VQERGDGALAKGESFAVHLLVRVRARMKVEAWVTSGEVLP